MEKGDFECEAAMVKFYFRAYTPHIGEHPDDCISKAIID